MYRRSVSEYFSTIGIFPFKSHSQPTACKVTTGKHKLSPTFKAARTLDVPVACLETQPLTPNVEIQEKALMFEYLMS